MASSATGVAGASRWRPLLTALVWVLVFAAAFGGWQVWKIFLEPHSYVLVIEAERDPLLTARSDAERVLVAMEIEFRAPDTGASLLRIPAEDALPRRAELTVRGRTLQDLVDQARLEAWVHLGTSSGELGSERISAPLAPPRVSEAGLVYRLGLDDAVRILGRRLQTEIAVRDQVGLEVEGLGSERPGELIEDERRPGVYRLAVGLSQVLRAEEDEGDLVIGVRNGSGREGRLRVPPSWLEGRDAADRVVRIEWTTEAPAPAPVTESAPPPVTETPAAAPSVTKQDPAPTRPPRPDPARVEAERQARISGLLADARSALAREDFEAVDRLAVELGGIAGAQQEFSTLQSELESARNAARARERLAEARRAVESALSDGDFDRAESALQPAARAGIEATQIERWKDAIASGREAAAQAAIAAALDRDRRGVRDAIARLERAFDELDVDLLYRAFPEFPASRRDQASNWSQYVSQDMSLEVLGDIRLDGDTASVRCRRTILYELKLGRHDPLPPDEVTIEMRRTDDGWRVVRWERSR